MSGAPPSAPLAAAPPAQLRRCLGQAGAFLCLFGSSLGCLTALGRLGFSLAEGGVLPRRLAAIDSGSQTPSAALLTLGLPVIGLARCWC